MTQGCCRHLVFFVIQLGEHLVHEYRIFERRGVRRLSEMSTQAEVLAWASTDTLGRVVKPETQAHRHQDQEYLEHCSRLHYGTDEVLRHREGDSAD